MGRAGEHWRIKIQPILQGDLGEFDWQLAEQILEDFMTTANEVNARIKDSRKKRRGGLNQATSQIKKTSTKH
jgi:hypothetical protein